MSDARAPEADLAAIELALGLLEGDERAAALRRLLSDPAFAREVDWWRDTFAQLFQHWPEEAPPPGVLPRIESAIGGQRATGVAGWWRGLAVASSLAAAALLAVLVLRPAPAPERVPVRVPVAVASPSPVPVPVPSPVATVPRTLLVAQLAGDRGEPMPALFDPVTRELRIGATTLGEPGRSVELWVIPAGGTPHPLGLLETAGRTRVPIDAAAERRLVAGATLALSIEPLGGSTTGAPTGPVVATGPLNNI